MQGPQALSHPGKIRAAGSSVEPEKHGVFLACSCCIDGLLGVENQIHQVLQAQWLVDEQREGLRHVLDCPQGDEKQTVQPDVPYKVFSERWSSLFRLLSSRSPKQSIAQPNTTKVMIGHRPGVVKAGGFNSAETRCTSWMAMVARQRVRAVRNGWR